MRQLPKIFCIKEKNEKNYLCFILNYFTRCLLTIGLLKTNQYKWQYKNKDDTKLRNWLKQFKAKGYLMNGMLSVWILLMKLWYKDIVKYLIVSFEYWGHISYLVWKMSNFLECCIFTDTTKTHYKNMGLVVYACVKW